jgi:hypothetical protein
MLSNHQHPTLRQHGKELKWNGRGQPSLRKKQLAKNSAEKTMQNTTSLWQSGLPVFQGSAKWFSESKVVLGKLTVRSGYSRKPLAVPGNFSFEQAL